MDQTLGNRISTLRKTKKLTQDQLAEQLGVTAQAVSKWENDQSCPDITMLPKLAEIFGCSTDELLGIDPAKTVHEAEVVTEAHGTDEDGPHMDNDGFEYQTENGIRKGSIGFALLVLAVGGLTLANHLLSWGASFWSILWPTAIIIYGLFGSMPGFSFGRLGCVAFGAYFLLDNLDLLPFELGWELVLPIALLLFGISLLIKALRNPRSRTIRFTNQGSRHSTYTCTADGETFCCDNSFCYDNYLVKLPRLSGGTVDIAFGSTTVDLSGAEAVSDNCTISADVAFGQCTILVPQKYRIALTKDAAFGSVRVKGDPTSITAGTIGIVADVAFGEITIRYI